MSTPQPIRRKRRILLTAITAAVALGVLGYLGFRRWQLHHSYEVYVSGARTGEYPLYSRTLMDENQGTLRRWLEAELVQNQEVPVHRRVRISCQMRLLYMWREPEDVAILWRRAAMGFVVVPSVESLVPNAEGLVEIQRGLCHTLFRYLEWIYRERCGSREEGLRTLEVELRKRELGPGVREFAEVWFRALEEHRRKAAQEAREEGGGADHSTVPGK